MKHDGLIYIMGVRAGRFRFFILADQRERERERDRERERGGWSTWLVMSQGPD